MADINASDNTEEFIAYEETHRHRWKHIDEKVDIQKTKPLLHPDRRNLPSGAYLPAGGKNILLSGDVLRGPRPPGKAMTEEVMVEDPGPRGEGHTPQGQERGGKRSYLPRELRIKLYDEVKRLRRDGLRYSEIIEDIQRRYGVTLSKSHISYWTHGIHDPYNGRYIPSIEFLEPSEELAYVIGVKVGDGYTYKRRRTVKGYNKAIIGLEVKDREFAVEFGRYLAKILKREPIKPRYRNDVGRYVVEIWSQTLYELLKKPVDLDKLKKYIEHCERCMAAFIKGFADSEGYVNKRGCIYISNTDYELLEYVKDLLKRLGIESTGPWPKRLQGKTFYDPKRMKRYTCKKECFHIYIRAGSNINFYKNIGFIIGRKQRRLENYVKKHQTRKH
jgi:intein-encoded DNA endonuclease-like protein